MGPTCRAGGGSRQRAGGAALFRTAKVEITVQYVRLSALSDATEALFEDFYAARGLAFEPTAFDGRYDPCYHQACDTFSNNSNDVLDLNSDAIAFATLTYAMDTSSVNGA
jgi:hypothetical protein